MNKKFLFASAMIIFCAVPAMATEISCDVSEWASAKADKPTAQYTLNYSSTTPALGYNTSPKTLKGDIGFGVEGQLAPGDNETVIRFTINGGKKNMRQIVAIAPATHLTYAGPVAKGFMQVECNLK